MSDPQAKLGTLKKVDLRSIWASESDHFTPWLAAEDNLRNLGDVIGIELELEATEKDVGPFRADILCKDTASDRWVLVENQLEQTNHTHLGQVVTYAAGLGAATVVWIADRFTDEHRAAMDWLNEISGSDIGFFGLEVELWRIGDSLAAPKFNIVSNPNEWTKDITSAASAVERGELSDKRKRQLRFFTEFRQFVLDNTEGFKPAPPRPRGRIRIGTGNPGYTLGAVASFWNSVTNNYELQEIRAEFRFVGQDALDNFDQLELMKSEVEKKIPEELYWHGPSESKSRRIYIRRDADLYTEDDWPNQFRWLVEKLEALENSLGPLMAEIETDQ
ncbi:MAG: DUF4268 domain-containing protein [Anaerolineales bacterium]